MTYRINTNQTADSGAIWSSFLAHGNPATTISSVVGNVSCSRGRTGEISPKDFPRRGGGGQRKGEKGWLRYESGLTLADERKGGRRGNGGWNGGGGGGGLISWALVGVWYWYANERSSSTREHSGGNSGGRKEDSWSCAISQCAHPLKCRARSVFRERYRIEVTRAQPDTHV